MDRTRMVASDLDGTLQTLQQAVSQDSLRANASDWNASFQPWIGKSRG